MVTVSASRRLNASTLVPSARAVARPVAGTGHRPRAYHGLNGPVNRQRSTHGQTSAHLDRRRRTRCAEVCPCVLRCRLTGPFSPWYALGRCPVPATGRATARAEGTSVDALSRLEAETVTILREVYRASTKP